MERTSFVADITIQN